MVILFFFLRIETGHEVLDELIGRCCGELSIIIYGDALHGLSRIKRQKSLLVAYAI